VAGVFVASVRDEAEEVAELVLDHEALHLAAIDCEKALPANLVRGDDRKRLCHEGTTPFALAAAVGGVVRDEEQIDGLGSSL